jgi:hypothetical protein
MTLSMRIITAAAGVALLASPAIAQPTELHPYAPAAGAAHAYRSVPRTYANEPAYRMYRAPAERSRNADDCNSVWANCGYPH